MIYRHLGMRKPLVTEDQIAAQERLRAVGRKNLQSTLEQARQDWRRTERTWLLVVMLIMLLGILIPAAWLLYGGLK